MFEQGCVRGSTSTRESDRKKLERRHPDRKQTSELETAAVLCAIAMRYDMLRTLAYA